MIGILECDRTQIVKETLLQEIMETGSEFAILDITGVPAVDTLAESGEISAAFNLCAVRCSSSQKTGRFQPPSCL